PRNPSLELKMSAAGPLTSVALAIISAALWELSVLVRAPVMLQAPLQYSALVNAIVAVFNLIPAFPMDGGRVLRSLLWRRSGDIIRATRTASNIGRWIAYFMIAAGLFSLVTDGFSTGLWLILIGLFISNGAQSSLRQTIVQEDLRDLRARDIMARNIDSVHPGMTLE